jgi:carbamoyltransferase
MLEIPVIPDRSILGLNYSGVHDTTIAIVSSTGQIVFASSLERVSRVKQDGRPPSRLLENFPWEKIAKVAISTDSEPWLPKNTTSLVHPSPLQLPRSVCLKHGDKFYEYLESLPAPKEFVCHELSHVSSSFWLSGFQKSLCFSYDGGMFNCPWFGGLYSADINDGIEPLDRFASSHYTKITSLYTVVTALLGFTPLKHEGKITGLAAYGKPNTRCREILEDLLYQDYYLMEMMLEWIYIYSSEINPIFVVHGQIKERLSSKFQGISREDIAATLQHMSEEHIISILSNALKQGWNYESICLAGGLFANVKINQKIKEFGFKNIFVAPPMTDDGTALGAALHAASKNPNFDSKKVSSMFWGYAFDESEITKSINRFTLKFEVLERPADFIADKLISGAVIGIFQGRMEYGPRALGNRSIISQATRSDINNELNKKLCRTEFMPFAPMTRIEDARDCYDGLDGAEHAAEFMTITFNCTNLMKSQSPAVVHIDGTARPQLVSKEGHPLIYEIITSYKSKTGINSIINTSFNIHEEPIVCSPIDAIEGFLSSGLDFLYFEGGYIVDFQKNKDIALSYLQNNRGKISQKEQRLQAINLELLRKTETYDMQLNEKEAEISLLSATANERLKLIIELDKALQESDKDLRHYKRSFLLKMHSFLQKWF